MYTVYIYCYLWHDRELFGYHAFDVCDSMTVGKSSDDTVQYKSGKNIYLQLLSL